METVVDRDNLLLIIQFKSYYVVWKLSSAVRQPSLQFCLNRTM